jgi:hypothetical protein
MATLSYSQAARRAFSVKHDEMPARNVPLNTKQMKENEKELYSKECVAESINQIIRQTTKVVDLNYRERFSCYLAAILAKNKEVVAVRLEILSDGCKVYLSKNLAWLKTDIEYIDKIMNYLKIISKNAPAISIDTGKAFTEEVRLYCSAKLESRFEKLNNYTQNNSDNEHVKAFNNFVSTEMGITNNIYLICEDYYRKVRYDSSIDPKFLGYIRKVGSYVCSVIGIIECARKIKYKSLFSNIKLYKLEPDIIYDQPIFSWNNIIKRFINDDNKYKRFMDNCLEEPKVMSRREKVYTHKNITQQLDGNDVKKNIFLHAEMNIVAFIIDNKIKNREFIAVSKRCCYLCELYIDFARKHGYNIIIKQQDTFLEEDEDYFDSISKIHSGWKLPHVKDNDFKIRSLRYILDDLDLIIDNKIEYYKRDSDSDEDRDLINDMEEYLLMFNLERLSSIY